MRNLTPLLLLTGLVGCIPTEDIAFDVEAGVAFTHTESVDLLSEGFTFTTTDAPEGVSITEGEQDDEVVFDGTLEAGEYAFTIDFDHYGDVGSGPSRWEVTILAE